VTKPPSRKICFREAVDLFRQIIFR